MSTRTDPAAQIDIDALEQDFDQLENMADCVRLSGYALADPLARARQGQMAREVARVERRKGADDTEVTLRQANLDRANARFELLYEERDRAQVARPEFDAETATIYGRVTDAGVPQTDMTVMAIGDGERLAFTCTDDLGVFSMSVPPDIELVLSVRSKEGADLYRDAETTSVAKGQQLYREIDLSRGAEPPCPDPGDPDTPQPEEFTMVDLTGQPETRAVSVIASLGLKLGARKVEPTADMIGLILSHDPEAGSTVKLGDAVDIVVGGKVQITVPDLVGLTLDQAQATLKKAGLAQGEVKLVPVVNERAGLVVDQEPKAGTEADPGATVDISVGVAQEPEPDLVAVPNVTGLSRDEAEAKLKEADLSVGAISEVPVAGGQVGKVVNQSPAAGAKVDPGSAVALVIGKKAEEQPDEIKVPNVIGATRKDAEAILKGAGLSVGDIKTQLVPYSQAGRVLDQSLGVGSTANPGDPVALVIGERRVTVDQRRVPLVTGRKSDEAAELLKAAGFTMATRETAVTAPAQVGVVLAQNPQPGALAPAGSTVAVRVGTQLREPGRGGGVIRGGQTVNPVVGRIIGLTEVRLGADAGVAETLEKANITTLADIDKLLSMDRREARETLGLRTLADSDRMLRALKRARAQVED